MIEPIIDESKVIIRPVRQYMSFYKTINKFLLRHTLSFSMKLFLFDVISRIWCRCIGHKWDKTDKYKQPCKRCTAVRWLVIDQYKQAVGEKCVEWRVLD